MGNKLELTWYGKEEPLKIEPRLLIENVKLSYGCDNDGITDNMLIHGDNLLALRDWKKYIFEAEVFKSTILLYEICRHNERTVL